MPSRVCGGGPGCQSLWIVTLEPFGKNVHPFRELIIAAEVGREGHSAIPLLLVFACTPSFPLAADGASPPSATTGTPVDPPGGGPVDMPDKALAHDNLAHVEFVGRKKPKNLHPFRELIIGAEVGREGHSVLSAG